MPTVLAQHIHPVPPPSVHLKCSLKVSLSTGPNGLVSTNTNSKSMSSMLSSVAGGVSKKKFWKGEERRVEAREERKAALEESSESADLRER